jgi:hypothetical protein
MDENELFLLKIKWQQLTAKLTQQLGYTPDLNAVLFLVGVQEFGKGVRDFSKDEKQNLMHVGTCCLMSQYNYYEFEGYDSEGWPHWRMAKKIPALTLKEQDILLKKAAVDYFENNGIL